MKAYFIIILLAIYGCGNLKFVSDRPQSQTDGKSFYSEYINDMSILDQIDNVLIKNGDTTAILLALRKVKSADFKIYSMSAIANIYYQKGDLEQAKKYYIEFLRCNGSFPSFIDTNYCSQEECSVYLKQRSVQLMTIIKNISETDQKFRQTNIYNQGKLDKENFIEFDNYVIKYGWPTLTQIGNDRSVRSFSSFMHHIPDSLKIKYLDSCVYYAKRGLDSWRTCEILTSKLIADNSIKSQNSVYSIFDNGDAEIDDLEVMELHSCIRYIKHNKKLSFVIYYDASCSQLGINAHIKAIELFPELKDRILLREIKNSPLMLKNNRYQCISYKVESFKSSE